MHTISEKKLLLLRPDDILPSPDQPRKSFDEYELRSLAESILANGIIEPLCVRQAGKNKYLLISGERRLRAAKMVGIRRLPCVVHNTDEKDAAVFTLAENIQRSDLNFFEEAAAIDRLLGLYGISRAEMAKRLGMAQSTLANKLQLLKIGTLERERILAANLTERHALALLPLNKADMSAALDIVTGEQLSVKKTEELVRSMLKPPFEQQKDLNEPQQDTQPVRKTAIGDVKLFSNSLSKLLTTMQNAGIQASSHSRETDSYIEYEVRIEKTGQLTFAGI